MGACGTGTELDDWDFDGTDDEEDEYEAERLSALNVWRNWGMRRSMVVVDGEARFGYLFGQAGFRV